jgi:hypothetical protein
MTYRLNSYLALSALKRRARFSLRALFFVFTLISLWFGYFFNRVQNERRVAEVIAAASGTIVYDSQVRPSDSDRTVERSPPGPEWLRRYLGPHWFGQIVKVRLNEFSSESNDFAVVGPHLANLPALRSLSLSGGDLNLEDCELLGRLAQIEELSLWPESVIGTQHAAALARARDLKSFDLHYAKISAGALREFAAMTNLNEISISCDSYDRQTGMPLKEYYLNDDAAKALASFPALRSVMLFHTQITDEGVQALCNLSQLETLVVSSPRITSNTFEYIARLKHLKHLGTWAWRINDADCAKLSRMPNLVSLDLQTNLTNSSVPHLLRFERLERLTLRGGQITDDSVQYLCIMRNLTWLNLSKTSIQKNSGAAALLKQSLPVCRILLPKTEREKESERRFTKWKWGGFQSSIQIRSQPDTTSTTRRHDKPK